MRYLLLLATLLIFTGPSFAEIYKWVDAEGQVHFSDVKPEDEDQAVAEVRIDVEVGSYQAVTENSYKTKVTKDAPDPPVRPKKKVIMFATSWCGYCKKARTYFKKKGIRYKEYDIEKSSMGKRLYDRMQVTGVPVILVGRKRLIGFSASRFNRLYNK